MGSGSAEESGASTERSRGNLGSDIGADQVVHPTGGERSSGVYTPSSGAGPEATPDAGRVSQAAGSADSSGGVSLNLGNIVDDLTGDRERPLDDLRRPNTPR
jgi:hypothetical protein